MAVYIWQAEIYTCLNKFKYKFKILLKGASLFGTGFKILFFIVYRVSAFKHELNIALFAHRIAQF